VEASSLARLGLERTSSARAEIDWRLAGVFAVGVLGLYALYAVAIYTLLVFVF